ncbi:hypothetical protein AMK33_11195 [Streptomyces sp. CB02400]|nr:hypothetical protein AMK33_11195 [Streptomyces sp. CB02400]
MRVAALGLSMPGTSALKIVRGVRLDGLTPAQFEGTVAAHFPQSHTTRLLRNFTIRRWIRSQVVGLAETAHSAPSDMGRLVRARGHAKGADHPTQVIGPFARREKDYRRCCESATVTSTRWNSFSSL